MPARRGKSFPAPPVLLQRRATDEFRAPDYGPRERQALDRVLSAGPTSARRVDVPLADYWSGRRGTAAGLLALNRARGDAFYQVPDEAELDEQAAVEALGGDQFVIDVQTHYVSDRPECDIWNQNISRLYREISPEFWSGVDEIETYNLAEYLRCVFLESETAVAILTSAPGMGPERMLFNHELAGTREFFGHLGQTGRLLNHCVVQPEAAGEIGAMPEYRERYRPAGWKVYTIGSVARGFGVEGGGWWLDDEETGLPFLEKVRESGVSLVCAHKGISNLVPTGSPRDVGPAAAAFPDIRFLIYHSGYEIPSGAAPEEGPYSEETAHVGTNRLIKSLRDANIGRGSNVYAELGSTWFSLIRRPEEAAHVLGKLLLSVGEDNVLWGTDACWYGPAQVVIDAFRAFQIPKELRERHGYPELTPELKAKVLGLNAARVYGIDIENVRRLSTSDDLGWVRRAIGEYRQHGVPGSTP